MHERWSRCPARDVNAKDRSGTAVPIGSIPPLIASAVELEEEEAEAEAEADDDDDAVGWRAGGPRSSGSDQLARGGGALVVPRPMDK